MVRSPFLTAEGKSPGSEAEEVKDRSAETARWSASCLSCCPPGLAVLFFWPRRFPQNAVCVKVDKVEGRTKDLVREERPSSSALEGE